MLATGEDVLTRSYLIDAIKALIEFGKIEKVEWVGISKTDNNFPRHPSRANNTKFEDYDPEQILNQRK